MEEKERYELTDTDCILDTERDIVVSDVCDVVANADIITDLLNQQDKRIKELEQENQQLKQSQKQLAIGELEKLREYIVLNDEYDEEIGCNIIKTFDLIEDLADKIKSLKGEE